MTRIIAGVAGGRTIRTPKGRDTRPTTDRVREALFSRVEALLDLDGARVLDLYAGSGALGLEAVSRGAAHLLAVEKHRPTAGLVEANARDLGFTDRVQVRSAPVEVVLAGGNDEGVDGGEGDRGGGYHLVLADPPYPLGEEGLAQVLIALVDGDWLDPDALVLVERSSRSPRPTWPEGLRHLDSRTYGETALHLAEPRRGLLGQGPARRERRPVLGQDRDMTSRRTSLDSAADDTTVAELVLVRHAESIGNVADREAVDARRPTLDLDIRDADVELSETGVQQARAVRDHLRSLPEDERPTAVVSSPYRRARQTAELATEGLDVPLVVDERVRERDLGAYDGLTWIGIERDFPQESARRARIGKYYYRPPGGESWCDVVLRVRQLVLEIQERYAGERLWVFSHQATIMSFRVALEGLEEADILKAHKETPVANCSLTTYRPGDDGLELTSYGDTTAVDRAGEQVTHEPAHDESQDET